jgi:adenine-specific DNA-methyltransferase
VTLDFGIPLSAKITQNGDVFSVNDNHLIAYFKQVDTALITEIAKKKPHYAVIRDGNFTYASAIVNFDQVVATYSPNTERKVL